MTTMKNRGFTLIEIANALALMGILAGVAYPKVSRAYAGYQVRGAKDAIVTIHAKARATAMQRGKTTFLHFRGDTLEIRSTNPVSGATETVGVIESMQRRFGVALTSTHDSLMFDGRGLGPMNAGIAAIYLSTGAYSDSLRISPMGRVMR
jgi:prepilin-type N-terminal cleavage/methylation domain-containing protein